MALHPKISNPEKWGIASAGEQETMNATASRLRAQRLGLLAGIKSVSGLSDVSLVSIVVPSLGVPFRILHKAWDKP